MNLKPTEQFSIVRQLDNPADTSTYYVLAKIRDSKTDELLDTVRLVDKGGQRFVKNWEVIPDPSGQGRYIDIETDVYTDSDYTTPSDVYGIENHVYLVVERQLGMNQGGVDIGADVNYKKIKQIVQEVVDAKEIPEPKETDLSSIKKAIDNVLKAVSDLKIPKETNIDPLAKAISALSNELNTKHKQTLDSIEKKPITEKTDLTPIMDRLAEIDHKNIMDGLNKTSEDMHKFLGGDIQKIFDAFKTLEKTIKTMPYLVNFPVEKEVDLKDKRVRKI